MLDFLIYLHDIEISKAPQKDFAISFILVMN